MGNIQLTLYELNQILSKLKSIKALTDNDYIHATVDNILKILNK